MKKPRQSANELADRIRAVAEEKDLAGRWALLAHELNRRKIANMTGTAWTRTTIGTFCRNHGITASAPQAQPTGSLPQRLATSTTAATQTGRAEASGSATTSAPQQTTGNDTTTATDLDVETISTLREVASWWQDRKATGDPMEAASGPRGPEHRPVFVGARRNTGIRINSRLLEDALAKSQWPEEARKLGGGGLSPLIERLLWHYLDFGEKYLEPDE